MASSADRRTAEDVSAPHNIVACVDDMESARSLIESLEEAGVEASDISLLGAEPAQPDETAADAGPSGSAAKGAAVGGATGAALGGLAGISIGIPGVGPLIAGGLWAVFGGALGTSLGGVKNLSLSEAWKHTFDMVADGQVAVGVHSSDPDEIATAASVFERTTTNTIRRFDD